MTTLGTTRHPGDAEYAAAAAAMQDTYGLPPVSQPTGAVVRHGRLLSVYAIGDYCGFNAEDGRHYRGTILERNDDDDTYLVRCHVIGHGSVVMQAHASQFAPW